MIQNTHQLDAFQQAATLQYQLTHTLSCAAALPLLRSCRGAALILARTFWSAQAYLGQGTRS